MTTTTTTTSTTTILGTEFIARTIANNINSISKVFGIVGVPITPIAYALQKEGIEFYGFRNEQSCSYASSVAGYLSAKPSICMTVSGPGMVHALAGVLNAMSNGWPMILLSSSISTNDIGKGAFQEAEQLKLSTCYCKKSFNVIDINQFPDILKEAIETSVHGRPGPVYIQLPTNVIHSKSVEIPTPMPMANISVAKEPIEQPLIDSTIQLLKSSKKPLIIGGKGASLARCEDQLGQFVSQSKIPFLPSPMGKGLIADDSEYVVSAARSFALKNADTILVLGARMNWMFNFGSSPTFSSNVKFIIIDIDANESKSNVNIVPTIGIQNDINQFLLQLNQSWSNHNNNNNNNNGYQEWWSQLKPEIESKSKLLLQLLKQPQINTTDYLTYHQVYNQLVCSKLFDAEQTIFVNEGANTMDIGRLCITHNRPRCRLDAGTLGTMGVGVGYAIAAAIVCPQQKVVCVQGDSAFGFSAMEVEVAKRYHLPIVFIVLNNNGIYEGLESMEDPKYHESTRSAALSLPPTSLSFDTHYEKIIEAFGCPGFYLDNLVDIDRICQQITSNQVELPCLLNIKIKPTGSKPKIVH
ncbi:hypothetical protein CYY_002679 [Polysphondylium violaceum]|uniref:2-hydroxyacyl-CoA lyase n=1 Tax=Polysphondylium violaceum TaxID=133409 RepID=A0A8J4V9E5_9MYCE|nr:hypothetical protein CYY_002679 [Polysphondylium violaceum]